MKRFTVRLQFHGDLNVFLAPKSGEAVIERQLTEKTSIKDVIESCGVPHPEVDLILIDEQPVDFDVTVSNDTRVDVFSVENHDTYRPEQRLQTIEAITFITDVHLGGLTRNLRLLGFDVAYNQNLGDRQLLEVMTRESRALLTRDRRLLMHAIVQHGYFPRSQNPNEQTIEVVRRFKLSESMAPFTRCLRCNAPLEKAAKTDVTINSNRLPEPTTTSFVAVLVATRSTGRDRTFPSCKSESRKFARAL